MVAYAVLEVHEGFEAWEEFEGFEEVEDLTEVEDHVLCGLLVGFRDLGISHNFI